MVSFFKWVITPNLDILIASKCLTIHQRTYHGQLWETPLGADRTVLPTEAMLSFSVRAWLVRASEVSQPKLAHIKQTRNEGESATRPRKTKSPTTIVNNFLSVFNFFSSPCQELFVLFLIFFDRFFLELLPPKETVMSKIIIIFIFDCFF